MNIFKWLGDGGAGIGSDIGNNAADTLTKNGIELRHSTNFKIPN
jgi:hypothetical protein